MAALDDILTWAEKLPPWQRDALRRLAERGSLLSSDISDLVHLAKADFGIALPAGMKPADPISLPSFRKGEAVPDAITLLGLDRPQNINALADDQEVPFAPRGITVIFGDNGSGKTGFGRLLRKLCWARHSPKVILPNADTGDTRAQQVEVRYRLGEVDQPTYTWKVGEAPPPELRRICVFDADCASVYINDEQEVAYAPYGLDLFGKLATTCDKVRAEVVKELADVKEKAAVWPPALDGTPVAPLLARLPDPVALQELQAARPLTGEETERLTALGRTLEELKKVAPHEKVKKLRAQAVRYADVRQRLVAVTSGLSVEVVREFEKSLEDAELKARAAKAASQLALGAGLLPGTGSAVWEELWEAARKFSVEAYPDRDFPATAAGDRCLLCQQPLEADAPARLKNFEAFIKAEAATASQESAADVERRRAAIQNLSCTWPDLESLKAEFATTEAGLDESLASFLTGAATRQSWLVAARHNSDWSTVPVLATSPADRFKELADASEEQAKDIEDAIDDVKRQKQEQQWKLLYARDWVPNSQREIADESRRLELQGTLTKLSTSGTDTTTITTKGNRLTKVHVTKALTNRFLAELEGLHVGHLGVQVQVKGGAKGVTTHQLVLNRQAGRDVAQILSTGERNIVALAAFFAELDPERSDAIIFDDPVSSLDQDRREEVAFRLCQEAERRQVVLWTHDLPFLGAILDRRDARKRPEVSVWTIKNLNGMAGVVDAQMPWPVMKLSERIKKLRASLDELRSASEAKDIVRYEAGVRLFYGRLRDSWERAVEEELFKEVVQRWRKSVQTKRLCEVADNVCRSDFETIEAAMAYCSQHAHDQKSETPPPTPRVEALERDLATLADWVDGRRKKVKAKPALDPAVAKAAAKASPASQA